MIVIKKMGKSELEEIYLKILPTHFPQNEIKPWQKVSNLWDMGRYSGYLWEENDELIGYALLFAGEEQYWLLDYYAVMENKRNYGYGSKFLQEIKEVFKDESGIIIEAENPQFAEDNNDEILRKRRINFYLRNGCVPTGVWARAAGVEYVIVYIPCQKEMHTEIIGQQLDDIYHKVLRVGDLVQIRYK